MKKLAFIGAGNMGSAILGGVIKAGIVSPENITVADLYQPSLDRVKGEFGVNVTSDSSLAVKDADIVILAVKPNIINGVMKDIRDSIDGQKLIVSIAAATTIESIENIIGDDKKVVRVMPNTPALVGEAMSALSLNKNVTNDEMDFVVELFESFGKAEIVGEYLMDAVVGVSGSSPAYVFMFIEAMADAAVQTGMPRAQAYKFAAQSVYGAAKMVLETGKHPGELKDMVCSPGGTTIAAVETLEEHGLRNAVIKGQIACVDKSIAMAKK